ncbi:glycoside hydrolase [Roridomyces roridus]|uniref:Glycoside hydrolase n=1 Tax=Roridomyces roridus TaxID=1738132 RepID=A0AAD7CGU0_9AGAR|nr:glycoside hydrolase [Roridomyces roridus]
MSRFGFLASLLSTIVSLVAVQAAPFNTDELSPVARDNLLSSRATVPTAPYFVAYFDKYVSWNSLPAVSDLTGFNVFALSFIYSSSLQDNAAVWASIDADTRASIKSQYDAAGISLIVSAYGANVNPTSSGDDPTAAANYIANYVKTYDLNGVDVDYEDFTAIETAGTAVAWLSTFTKALRAQLPQGQYVITHAPVAPWFSPGIWPGDAYLGVDQAVGSLIDWYNIQFYNQGADYTTCDGLLSTSSSQWPQSSVFQIAANGVTLNKLVIGKPALVADSTTGFMDAATLATCLSTAKAQGWSAGAMTWQYPDATSAWIAQVRSLSFPVGQAGSAPGTTTTKPTTTTAPTATPTTVTSTSTTTPPSTTTKATTTTTSTASSTPTGGSCASAAAWKSDVAYTSGQVVSYNGALYTAKEWNQNEAPEGLSGAWTKTGSC